MPENKSLHEEIVRFLLRGEVNRETLEKGLRVELGECAAEGGMYAVREQEARRLLTALTDETVPPSDPPEGGDHPPGPSGGPGTEQPKPAPDDTP